MSSTAFPSPTAGRASSREPVLHREYSESTQQYVDEEIARLIEERYSRVLGLLTENRALLERTAAILLEKETIGEAEFRSILAGEIGGDSPVTGGSTG